jgi:hypothetical protein
MYLLFGTAVVITAFIRIIWTPPRCRKMPTAVVLYPFPRQRRCVVESILHLLHTVSTGHEHPGQYQGILFVPTFLKFLPRLLLQDLVPWLPRLFIGPVEVLGSAQDLTIQRERLGAPGPVGHALECAGSVRPWNPQSWRHDAI